MNKLRKWAGLVVVVAAAGAVSCTETAPEQSVTGPGPAAAKVASNRPAPITAADKSTGDPVLRFHAKNYADWVGRAHNKALDEFFVAMLANKGSPRNFCSAVLDFMSEAARVPAEKFRGTPTVRRGYALRGLSTTEACGRQLTDNGSMSSFASSSLAYSASVNVAGVSPACNSLLNQIGSAQSVATSAAGLAASLTAILYQADLLVSGERDLVYASASVTQSSFEYWAANIGSQSQQVDVTYGPCLAKYSTQATALSTCMGIGGGITPTRYENSGVKPMIVFASLSPSPCDAYLDVGSIGSYDFGGAVAGGAWGLFGGPGGVVLGAINGGGVASATESWSQFGKWAYCKRTGGGGPPRTPPKTT
ncbi:MAG: hypothetical protein ACXWMQ_07340 [Gemmatimonadaceae bacterium]